MGCLPRRRRLKASDEPTAFNGWLIFFLSVRIEKRKCAQRIIRKLSTYTYIIKLYIGLYIGSTRGGGDHRAHEGGGDRAGGSAQLVVAVIGPVVLRSSWWWAHEGAVVVVITVAAEPGCLWRSSWRR